MSHKAWTWPEVKLLERYNNRQVANMTGRTIESVRQQRRYASVKAKSIGTAFFAEDVAQIFMLRQSGFSVRHIATLKGVTHPTISLTIKNAEKHGFDYYPPRSQA